jgi:hypothetical protein
MTENSHPIPPAVADRNNIGREPRDAGEAREEELQVEGEEGVRPAATKSTFERIVGIVKDIVQTVGILFAGIFAILKFGLIDEPTLERHLEVSGSLNWLQRENFCIADLDIKIKNMSKSRLYVANIRGTSWLSEEPVKISDKISRFNVTDIMTANNLSDTFNDNHVPLVQSYVPGQSAHHTFEWFVPRKLNAIAVFRIEALDSAATPLDQQTQWDLVCGEDKKEGTKRPE